ncbi:MAG: hypothetical protein E7319_02765 [Clostridiales bacterium]|nr:hypothetical protein [Clostridiales bacterium]
MAKKVSPFAALTNDEKQIRWLEYQSVQLPYVKGDVDPIPDEGQTPEVCKQQTPDAESDCMSQRMQSEAPTSNISRSRTSSLYQEQPYEQKSRHRQYDAVIARMKQAEKRASSYFTLNQ